MCITKKITAYTIRSQSKNYFILYYTETFLLRNNVFNILLMFVSFLQTYYSIYSSHILFIYLFLLQISFCIYLLLALLIFFNHFHNNLLLYLVWHLCFFDYKLNQQSHSFLYIIKKFYKSSILSAKLEPSILFNSVSIYFNISNSNINKTHSFLH